MKAYVIKILFLVACLFSVITLALPPNKVVFFGDSLTDNGNLYKKLFHIIPKSPPYYLGRFSNGPTWAEMVGEKFSIVRNYAVGGATTLYHPPSRKFITLSLLKDQVASYQQDAFKNNEADVLFTIWIGANDYFFGQSPKETLTSQVIEKIKSAILELIKTNHAKHFLILNLPDLSSALVPDSQNLKELSRLHNQKLANLIEELRHSYQDIIFHTIDVDVLFSDSINHPDKYNEKYGTHIVNTKSACWTGDMTFNQLLLTKEAIQTEIDQRLLKESNLSFKARQEISSYIVNSPELFYTFTLTKNYAHGVVPCKNPDDYFFWDAVHPTQVVHRILGNIALEILQKEASVI